MKVASSIIFTIICLFSLPAQANSAQGGRTLSPEVKCEMKNGSIQSLPPLYCKIYDGKMV